MAAPSLSDILKQNVTDNAGALKLTAQDLTSSALTWLLDNLIKDTHLNINDAQVTATDDGATVSGTLPLVTVDFTVEVTFAQTNNEVSVSLSGSMADGDTLPLTHLIETYLTGADVIPDVTVSGLTLDAAADQFSMTASFSEAWSLPVGAQALTVDGLGMTLRYGAEKSASLTGTLHIAGVTTAVTYAMPGAFSIDTTIPKVAFGTFVNSFLHSAFAFPNGFPSITLLNAGIALSKTDTTFSLTLSASPAGWGTVEIDVMHQDGAWQAIAGFALPNTWKLSKLSSVFSPFDGLGFDTLALVVSTFSDGTFAFSATGAPALSDGAVEGVTFSAGLALSGGALGPVASLSGASTASVTATLGADMSDTYLEASLGGAIHIPSKSNLVLKDPGLTLHAKPFGVSIQGTVAIPVGSDTLEVVGRLTVTESEADFALDADHIPPALANPMGFHGVTLDEIGVELGLGFEPPSVDLGLEGQFHVGTAAPSSDKFAFVFGVEGEVVNPKLLSCSFAKLDLPTMFEALTDGAVTLPSALGKVSVTDFMIYWCDVDGTALPDGTLAAEGFGFNGKLDFFGWHAQGAFKIDTGGFSGSASMDAINLASGVFKLTGSGGKGGPSVVFSTDSSPYFAVSLDASIMGIAGVDVSGSIESADKFSFSLDAKLGFLEEKIAVTLAGPGSFAFASSIDLDIDVHVGPIKVPNTSLSLGTLHVNGGFKGALHVNFNDGTFSLSVSGGIAWEGQTWSMPTLKIKTPVKDLAKLPGVIEAHIVSEAATIFSDLLSDADEYLKVVEGGLVTGADDTYKVLRNVYGQTEAEAKKLLKQFQIHVSTTVHIDTPAGPHADTRAHLDTPAGPHSDTRAHIDTPGGPHVDTRAHIDTPRVHTDKHTFLGHVNITEVPHGDTHMPHVDTKTPPHGDTHAPHVDTHIPPHADGRAPHVDTQIPPHGDTHEHVDT